ALEKTFGGKHKNPAETSRESSAGVLPKSDSHICRRCSSGYNPRLTAGNCFAELCGSTAAKNPSARRAAWRRPLVEQTPRTECRAGGRSELESESARLPT